MENYPLVVAIVTNWNGIAIEYAGKSILERCIESLLKTDYPNKRIVVVDANSSDGSVQFIKKNYPNVHVKSIKDKGISFMINEGIKEALKRYPNFDYIVMVANDLEFTDYKWLKKMVEASKINPSIGMVTCKLKYPNGRIQHGGVILSPIGVVLIKDPKSSNVSKYQDYDINAAALICREAIFKVGGFDEVIGPFGWDDIDYSARMTKKFKIYYTSSTTAVHLESYSVFSKDKKIKKKWTKDEIEFGIRRNGYIFYLRYKPLMLPFHFVVDAISNFISVGDGIKIRNNILFRIKMQIPALKEALKMYKQTKIRKFSANLIQ